MKSVYVVGSANLDLVFRCKRFPQPGETLLGGSFMQFPGGKGANQAVAIGKLGGAVEFIGCVGADGFGEILLNTLKSACVGIENVSVAEKSASGTAMILVDDAAENLIVVAEGANAEVSAASVKSCLERARDPFVLAQLEIPMEAVSAASTFGQFILNPAPALAIPDEILVNCYGITPNETETEFLTGIRPVDTNSCREASKKLLDKGVGNVVITLGARGCYWSNGSAEAEVVPPQVTSVDTTAAGDAFNGALVFALSTGTSWSEALEIANITAALSTTKLGAQNSMPTREEVTRYKKF